MINLEHLKKYTEPEPGTERSTLPKSQLRDHESEEFEVESIVGHRYSKGKKRRLQFLVQWTGYSPLYDTWEDALGLKNAHEILQDYCKKHNI